ncbi:MAG: hypothetical protein ABW006_09510 [Hyphomicrobium sp.]
MSISPVGNSDAYDRYRRQAVDLLSPSGQQKTKVSTAPPPLPAVTDADHLATPSQFATKFKTDLTTLNSSQGGTSPTHAPHGGHHHFHGAAQTDTTTTDASATDDTTTGPDALSQSLDDFANLLKKAAGIAAIIV